jgi:hypothetical protein
VRSVRLGDLLVQHGVLSPDQKEQILRIQQLRGGAFGSLAEELFGVSPASVERAWAEQYAQYSPIVDPNDFEPETEVLNLIEKRQAWQFKLLPLQFTGDRLVVCSSQNNLPRAMKFAGWRLGHDTEFLLAKPRDLGEAMMRWYPMGGMTPAMIEGTAGVFLK